MRFIKGDFWGCSSRWNQCDIDLRHIRFDVIVLSYAVAYTIAYVTGIFISYYLNSRFVFSEYRESSEVPYSLFVTTSFWLGGFVCDG